MGVAVSTSYVWVPAAPGAACINSWSISLRQLRSRTLIAIRLLPIRKKRTEECIHLIPVLLLRIQPERLSDLLKATRLLKPIFNPLFLPLPGLYFP